MKQRHLVQMLVWLCTSFLPIHAYCAEVTLVGTWRNQTASDLVTYVTYHADHTFEGQVERNEVSEWKFKGTWGLVGAKLEYMYSESSLDRIPVGTRDEDVIIELTEKILMLRTRTGAVVEYVRVR